MFIDVLCHILVLMDRCDMMISLIIIRSDAGVGEHHHTSKKFCFRRGRFD